MSLPRRTPLGRGAGLKRTGGLKRGGRINPVSDKRKLENEDRRDALLALAARASYYCEVCPRLAAAGYALPRSAEKHQGQDGHETLTRGRGGSITDVDNMLFGCRIGHEWVHAHPREAERLGLLLPSRH